MFHSPADKTYRYSTVTRFLFVLPILLGGLIVWLIYDGNPNPDKVVLAIMTASSALASFLLWKLLYTPLLQLHAEGIYLEGAFSTKEVRWEEIRETRYRHVLMSTMLTQQLGLIGALVGAFMSRKKDAKKATEVLKVIGSTGKLTITNTFAKGGEAIQYVFDKVNLRIKEAARKQMQEGREADFGDLHLQHDGLRWKNKPVIPYGSLKRCDLVGMQLRIQAEGKWLDYASVAMQRIPNLFVALELIEEKRRQTPLGITSVASTSESMQVGFGI